MTEYFLKFVKTKINLPLPPNNFCGKATKKNFFHQDSNHNKNCWTKLAADLYGMNCVERFIAYGEVLEQPVERNRQHKKNNKNW